MRGTLAGATHDMFGVNSAGGIGILELLLRVGVGEKGGNESHTLSVLTLIRRGRLAAPVRFWHG